MNIYFDNAATTPMDPKVVDAMVPVMRDVYGNPSSIHTHGRMAKSLLEKSRKKVASFFNAIPSEISFTSGGTEADNMILKSCVQDLEVEHIITSSIEHHAVLHTVEELAQHQKVKFSVVNLHKNGDVDLQHLEELLIENHGKTLVSLMHANNEIGNILPLGRVGELCKKYHALFHSDTVQTMGHYYLDFEKLKVDFATCSAHKFHGPKGVGFMYANKKLKLKPMITGGGQERNMRAGTENLYGIVGLTTALELCYEHLEEHQDQIQGVKSYIIARLKEMFPDIAFNGNCESTASLYTVLNCCFPSSPLNDMFLYSLDIEGVSASGGSACSSGSNQGSHVLRSINVPTDRPSIRFSFGRFNTKAEVDRCMGVLEELYNTAVPK